MRRRRGAARRAVAQAARRGLRGRVCSGERGALRAAARRDIKSEGTGRARGVSHVVRQDGRAGSRARVSATRSRRRARPTPRRFVLATCLQPRRPRALRRAARAAARHRSRRTRRRTRRSVIALCAALSLAPLRTPRTRSLQALTVARRWAAELRAPPQRWRCLPLPCLCLRLRPRSLRPRSRSPCIWTLGSVTAACARSVLSVRAHWAPFLVAPVSADWSCAQLAAQALCARRRSLSAAWSSASTAALCLRACPTSWRSARAALAEPATHAPSCRACAPASLCAQAHPAAPAWARWRRRSCRPTQSWRPQPPSACCTARREQFRSRSPRTTTLTRRHARHSPVRHTSSKAYQTQRLMLASSRDRLPHHHGAGAGAFAGRRQRGHRPRDVRHGCGGCCGAHANVCASSVGALLERAGGGAGRRARGQGTWRVEQTAPSGGHHRLRTRAVSWRDASAPAQRALFSAPS